MLQSFYGMLKFGNNWKIRENIYILWSCVINEIIFNLKIYILNCSNILSYTDISVTSWLLLYRNR